MELRKKTFKEQFFSTESFGMGVFYTTNVLFMQFYLGEHCICAQTLAACE